MKTEIDKLFTDNYNRFPYSVVISSGDSRVICAIQKRETADAFSVVVGEAMQEELQENTINKIAIIPFKEYDEIQVTYVDELDDEEVTEKYIMEMAAIY